MPTPPPNDTVTELLSLFRSNKKFGHRGVIVGRDSKCNMPAEWISRNVHPGCCPLHLLEIHLTNNCGSRYACRETARWVASRAAAPALSHSGPRARHRWQRFRQISNRTGAAAQMAWPKGDSRCVDAEHSRARTSATD